MVVLATKCYVEGTARDRALDSLESLVANQLADLAVDWTIGLRADDFPSVTVEGTDAKVARNLLRERWGEITPHRVTGETAVGTFEAWDADGFVLDVGEPVELPADRLDLGPGSPSQIRQRFGLVQHLPLRFTIEDSGPRLANVERDRLFDWTRGDGRVNVNSATRAEVRATLNRAGHAQDVHTIERLGLLEQSVLCRPGTDPAGLVASVGEYLRSELLCVVP